MDAPVQAVYNPIADDIVVAEGLSFDYPGRRALDQVSFRLRRGAVTALVGPNGAGKTTLMRLLAALERPKSGRLTVVGHDAVADPRAVHRRVGYVRDDFGHYDELTAAQNLDHRVACLGLSAAARAAAVLAAAQDLNLADRLQDRAGDLSRGMRQRLALAGAMARGPELLILDEPASGLDPEARADLAQLFRRLRDQRGVSLLVSSHILTELDAYADDMIMMRDGRVVDHVQLHQRAQSQRLSIALAAPEPRFPALLAEVLPARAGAVLVRGDAAGAEITVDDNPSADAALLRALVAGGAAVARFSVQRAELQDEYLRRVGRGGGAAR